MLARDPVATYKIVLRYDGRAYFGWQRNADKPTIQGVLEDALSRVSEAQCVVQGAGRTDRGAHAEGQVGSVQLPAIDDGPAFVSRVNAALPGDIRVLSIESAADDYHAREAAQGKAYRYEIWNAPTCPPERQGLVWHVPQRLNVAAMEAACRVIVGEHDFASFATRPNFRQKSTRRDLQSVTLTHASPQISIVFVADGFLYKMVRNLVRALVRVGEERWTTDDLARALQARDRKASPGTAPASGLYLDRVF
jgi:tRNA pseudouridine38-40 synthase